MSFTGKRECYIAKYKAGVNAENKLQFVDIQFFTECGWSASEVLTLAETIPTAQNGYNSVSWSMTPIGVITDKPRGTATRAPGTTQGHSIIENLMEHMASKLGEDPIEFRIKNMIKEGKGSLTNYVDKSLAFFDHLPPCVNIFYGMNVDKK